MCEKVGGHCVVTQDGYYIMSAACVALGAAVLVGFVLPTVRRLQCEFWSFSVGELRGKEGGEGRNSQEIWRARKEEIPRMRGDLKVGSLADDVALPMSAWRVRLPE
jgi:hypothetical protein